MARPMVRRHHHLWLHNGGAGFVGLEGGVRIFLSLIKPTAEPAFGDVERFAFGLMGAITIDWGLRLFYFLRAAHSSKMGIKCISKPLWF